MSYALITQAANDPVLGDRIQGCVNEEANVNPALADTEFGVKVLADPWSAWRALQWPVAVDTNAAYESAVISGNPNPGGDPSVITDGMILSAVQANWPPDA